MAGCPALVMTLDWLLWAAHTISIGGVPALQHLYSRGGEAGPSRVLHERRRRRRGEAARVELHIAPLHVAQSACAPANSTARKGWRRDIQTPVALVSQIQLPFGWLVSWKSIRPGSKSAIGMKHWIDWFDLYFKFPLFGLDRFKLSL